MGRRSTEWGARKAATSGGTLTAPWAAAVRAATKAEKLAVGQAHPGPQLVGDGAE